MSEPDTLADDLIWKVADIATFIGRTPRQTWEALDKGELPARQVNGRWCASRSRLRAFFAGVDEGEAQRASPALEAPKEPVAPVRSSSRLKSRSTTATVHRLQPRPGRGRAA